MLFFTFCANIECTDVYMNFSFKLLWHFEICFLVFSIIGASTPEPRHHLHGTIYMILFLAGVSIIDTSYLFTYKNLIQICARDMLDIVWLYVLWYPNIAWYYWHLSSLIDATHQFFVNLDCMRALATPFILINKTHIFLRFVFDQQLIHVYWKYLI
jgi:hypothetical protein